MVLGEDELEIIFLEFKLFTAMVTNPSHYDVLALPSPSFTPFRISSEIIKLAYRRALLHNHPDKCLTASTNTSNHLSYTIDQISLAYKILLNPQTRSEYDLGLKISGALKASDADQPRTGLESIDLDDLSFHEKQFTWTKNCRCGNEEGFIITEKDLDENVEYGEVVVGCNGCSLWLRVLFTTVENREVDKVSGTPNS